MRILVSVIVVLSLLLAYGSKATARTPCAVEYAELKDMTTEDLTIHYCGYGEMADHANEGAAELIKKGSPQLASEFNDIALQCVKTMGTIRRLLKQRSAPAPKCTTAKTPRQR